MRLPMLREGLLVTLTLVLVSCQPPLRVVVTPELPELVALVHRVAPSLEVSIEDPTRPEINVLRVTTSPGWGVPAGSSAGTDLGAGPLATVWPLPASLATLGRGTTGWSALPLLYDPWGATVFLDKGAPPSALPSSLSWSTIIGGKAAVHAPGGDSSFRQAAFLLSRTRAEGIPREATKWFTQPVEPWNDALTHLPTLLLAPIWKPDTWRMSRGDLINFYKPGTSDLFVETYHAFETTNPPGTRRFLPLVSDGESALAARVVFVEYRGSDPALATDAVVKLLSSSWGKDVGQKSKWLAASLSAPEIDGTGAGIRQLVQKLPLVPVTDRAPANQNGVEFLEALQIAFETYPSR